MKSIRTLATVSAIVVLLMCIYSFLLGNKVFDGPLNVTWVATGNNDELILWDAKTGEKVRTIRRDAGWIDRIGFSPDSHWVVHSTSSGTAYVFDVVQTEGTPLPDLAEPSGDPE